jgi:DNA-binding NarL/FixJ family response regulator
MLDGGSRERPTGPPRRVLVAETIPLLRRGLVDLINERSDLKLVDAVDSVESVLSRSHQSSADIVILDADAPGTAAVRLTRELVNQGGTLVVVTTLQLDGRAIHDMFLAGAAACLSKRASEAEIAGSLEAISRGDVVVSVELGSRLAEYVRHKSETSVLGLTAREAQALALLADGMTTRSIARHLHVSESTVKTHLVHLYRKLGVSNKTAAVVVALELHMI